MSVNEQGSEIFVENGRFESRNRAGWLLRVECARQQVQFKKITREKFMKKKLRLFSEKYSQSSLLDSAKMTIMVCSRNMASLTKF